jgi:hypothetical protein
MTNPRKVLRLARAFPQKFPVGSLAAGKGLYIPVFFQSRTMNRPGGPRLNLAVGLLEAVEK